MGKRAKRLVHYEVLTNQVLGIIVGWLVVYFLYPVLLSLGPAVMASISSVVFFVISYIRLYAVRMYFKNKEIERKENGRDR
jgi:membrane protein implicated in regulation of membrane protease activity